MAHILKIIKKILASKLLLAITALVLLGGGYWGYKSFFGTSAAVRYVSAQVQKGTLIVSVSGSGQVSASNQVDVKPKASGDVVYIGVKNSQEVKAGSLIAQLDATDAQKAVRDAEANLESAKLSLEKLKQPADTLSTLQAENSLAQAKESKLDAEAALTKAYDDGFNTIANAFLDLPTVMAGLENTLFGKTIDSTQDNITWYINATDSRTDERDKAIRYENDVYTAYNSARAAYTKNFDDYKAVSRTSDTQTIESLISETYDTTKIIADAVKAANNYIDFVQDALELRHVNIPSAVSTQQSNLDSYTSKTNTHLLNLLGIQNTIKNSRDTIVNSDRSIAEKAESLAKLKAGPDTLDIQSQELSVK